MYGSSVDYTNECVRNAEKSMDGYIIFQALCHSGEDQIIILNLCDIQWVLLTSRREVNGILLDGKDDMEHNFP